MDAIKRVIGYSNLYDFYDLKENLGQGKYGLVKRGIHKKTSKEVAVKIVKKGIGGGGDEGGRVKQL